MSLLHRLFQKLKRKKKRPAPPSEIATGTKQLKTTKTSVLRYRSPKEEKEAQQPLDLGAEVKSSRVLSTTAEIPVDFSTKQEENISDMHGTLTGKGHRRAPSLDKKVPRPDEGKIHLDRSPAVTPQLPLPGSTSSNLEDQEYFHGILPRDEVTCLLQHEGDFLLRESSKAGDTQVVLSVFWNKMPRHFIIQSEGGAFKLEGPEFNSVVDLVNYYYSMKVPVTNRTNCQLVKPIRREKWELHNDDIHLIEQLGKGNFGEVWKAIYVNPSDPRDRMDVAVKTCKEEMPEEEKRKFLREARIMRRYIHPNIVRLIGVCAHRTPMMIVMELVPGGCLVAYLKRTKGHLRGKPLIAEKSQFCLDAACGMEYLASQKCLHRDLAARNCLLDKMNHVKISDFGMSREGSIYFISQAKQMPIKWTAPEVLFRGQFTTKSDIWSYGILMWEIFMDGINPYPGLNNKEVAELIQKDYRMDPPPLMPPALGHLMQQCWHGSKEMRPEFTTIKKTIQQFMTANH